MSGHIPISPSWPEDSFACGKQAVGASNPESVKDLLERTWKRLYDSPPRDSQDIIQHMEAEILRWRRADLEKS